MLASSHRLVHALMALEAGLYQSKFVAPRDAFRTFSHDVERTLYFLAASLRGSVLHPGDLPDLREDHHALLRSGDSQVERYALVNIETDRVTNSLNTLREQIVAWQRRNGGREGSTGRLSLYLLYAARATIVVELHACPSDCVSLPPAGESGCRRRDHLHWPAVIPVNATTVGFAYLLGILAIAATWGLIESIIASIAAMLCYNFYFLPPVGMFTIADPQNWVALFAFLTTALVASHLSDGKRSRPTMRRAGSVKPSSSTR